MQRGVAKPLAARVQSGHRARPQTGTLQRNAGGRARALERTLDVLRIEHLLEAVRALQRVGEYAPEAGGLQEALTSVAPGAGLVASPAILPGAGDLGLVWAEVSRW